ncbi:hypothetical protein LTR14_012197, partial [Exophiala xenobiotica]
PASCLMTLRLGTLMRMMSLPRESYERYLARLVCPPKPKTSFIKPQKQMQSLMDTLVTHPKRSILKQGRSRSGSNLHHSPLWQIFPLPANTRLLFPKILDTKDRN